MHTIMWFSTISQGGRKHHYPSHPSFRPQHKMFNTVSRSYYSGYMLNYCTIFGTIKTKICSCIFSYKILLRLLIEKNTVCCSRPTLIFWKINIVERIFPCMTEATLLTWRTLFYWILKYYISWVNVYAH